MAKIGTKTSLTPKYTYGEKEEIANRDKRGYQPNATSFKQIGPDGGGGNLNAPKHQVRSGKFKFNPPVS